MRPSFPDLVFWTSVVLCAVAQLGILRSVLAPRNVPAPRAGVPTARRATEVLWVVVPAIVLAVLLLLTWRAIHPSAPASGWRVPAATALADDAARDGGS